MNKQGALRIPKFRDNYLDTFFTEKDIREKVYRVKGPKNTHSIPTGVVLEHIALTTGRERDQIKDLIRKIDFRNGDIHHFFEHLAKGIASQYDKQAKVAHKESNVRKDLIKLGSTNPDLRPHIRSIMAELDRAMNKQGAKK